MALSDARLKRGVARIDAPLARLRRITGYTYDGVGRRHAGVLAQDVLGALPEAVQEARDGHGRMAVDYSALTALIVEALRELRAKAAAAGLLTPAS